MHWLNTPLKPWAVECQHWRFTKANDYYATQTLSTTASMLYSILHCLYEFESIFGQFLKLNENHYKFGQLFRLWIRFESKSLRKGIKHSVNQIYSYNSVNIKCWINSNNILIIIHTISTFSMHFWITFESQQWMRIMAMTINIMKIDFKNLNFISVSTIYSLISMHFQIINRLKS